MKVSVQRNQILAATHVMAKKDIRHYLNGVCIEITPKTVSVSATDGHIAFLSKNEIETEMDTDFVQIILPIEVIQAAKNVDKDENWILEFDDKAGIGKLADVPFTAISGRFPDIQRVIPKQNADGKITDQPVDFKYIKAWASVQKELGRKTQVYQPLPNDIDGRILLQFLNVQVAIQAMLK